MAHRESRLGLHGALLGSCLFALAVGCGGGTRPGDEGGDEPGAGGDDGAAGSGGGGRSGDMGGKPGPTGGRIVPTAPLLHRLNRTELGHALRDLLGADRGLLADLPADNITNGFDNVGDGLSVSSTHVDVLRTAFARAVDQGLGTAASAGPARGRVLTCDVTKAGASCVRTVVRAFARRAWRRPPTDAEVDRLVALEAKARELGLDAEGALRHVLVATLLSPHFVYKVEIDPDLTATKAHPLSQHELASRLSFLLWASLPDDELAGRADRGELDDVDAVQAEVRRMLKDPRARSLAEDFAGQWLQTRQIEPHEVDAAKFGAWTIDLARVARREVEGFFSWLVDSDRPLTDLVTSDVGFADAKLASHYGLPAPTGTPDGTGLARVTMPANRKAGVLGKAGVLTLTSYPTRTSVVKRGVWVLTQLLCSAPPPPPPGAEEIDPTRVPADAPLRKRMEIHRESPECNACHKYMDPIGFGLESFDAIGRHRTMDGKEPVDDSGELPGGIKFRGAAELGAILARDDRFLGCATQQIATYALGRGMGDDDQAALAAMTAKAGGTGGHLRAILEAVVSNDTFRMRLPEGK